MDNNKNLAKIAKNGKPNIIWTASKRWRKVDASISQTHCIKYDWSPLRKRRRRKERVARARGRRREKERR